MKEERKTIAVNGKEYYLDSLDQKSLNALSDINLIDNEIKKYQLSISIATVAKGVFEDIIKNNSSTFEEVSAKEAAKK